MRDDEVCDAVSGATGLCTDSAAEPHRPEEKGRRERRIIPVSKSKTHRSLSLSREPLVSSACRRRGSARRFRRVSARIASENLADSRFDKFEIFVLAKRKEGKSDNGAYTNGAFFFVACYFILDGQP